MYPGPSGPQCGDILESGVPSSFPWYLPESVWHWEIPGPPWWRQRMLAASAGLGYMIQIGRTVARPDIVIVGMVVIGAIRAILSGFLSRAEKYFLRWKVNRVGGSKEYGCSKPNSRKH